MSEEVYEAVARATSGFVEAPAGCGKTEAIVRTVGSYCADRQLILTHTHAGVDALRQRFKKHEVATSKYHVDTIAGWAWGWVRKYPRSALYDGSIDLANWDDVYAAMSTLIQTGFVKQGILNSYAGVIVDEYQDCTIPMHQLITQLKDLLPCRILGDELQGVFGFRGQQLIGWQDVRREFVTDLGALRTPYRWIKAENRALGDWLVNARPAFQQNLEPDFAASPIVHKTITYRELATELNDLTNQKQGRICVIGPKSRRLSPAIETGLVKRSYKILEPNELPALRNLIKPLSDGTLQQKATASMSFIKETYGSISAADKTFIGKLLNGEGQRPTRADRKKICANYAEGATPQLLRDLLEYVERQNKVNCKLRESISALKCILEEHVLTGADLRILYADEIAKRKYQSRSNILRCIGSTLLVKGLEFDHAIVLRGSNWGNSKDLYVALTRGSKSVTLLDLAA
ncbi:MAG: AAA family ATPase [Aliivibrio sp.]|uniref:AAA family ATPase n=1 Tax=Aliivibrio sp. TaxID=1872443 RepID=UPI001A3CB038|nr:AAA family ATPase [Aliivibrio sp.]